MRFVFIIEGEPNHIFNLTFLTKNKTIINLDIDHLIEIKKSGNKTILVYDNISEDNKPFNEHAYILEDSNLIAYKAGANLKIIDIHIYDKRDKYEIYMINNEKVNYAIQEIVKEEIV